MKLKLTFPKEINHHDAVTCIVWTNNEDVISCGDDHQVLRTRLETSEVSRLCLLPPTVYPTHVDIQSSSSAKKQGQHQLLITSSDGFLHLMSSSGRIEKSVEAHKGAALVGRWSPDLSSLLTGGEDGTLKVWSKSGMLRTVVSQGNYPVYSACWSADQSHILYTSGKHLVIKSLAPNTKPNRWRAHEGLAVTVAWHHVRGTIVSGGEDCRYKVWDSDGRLVYSSVSHQTPVSAVAWSPSGHVFAVSSHNSIRLCNSAGWCEWLGKSETGSIYGLSWSPDGTRLAATTASRSVLIAHLIGRKFEWKEWEVEGVSNKSIRLTESSSREERLETSERVLMMAVGWGRLAVLSASQCCLYPIDNLTCSTVIDIKEPPVYHLTLSSRHVLLVENSVVSVYTHDGRLTCSLRWPGFQPSRFAPHHISLSPDTVVTRRHNNDKMVDLVQVGGKGVTSSWTHGSPVSCVQLSQSGPSEDRMLALLDTDNQLYVARIYPLPAHHSNLSKLGSMIESIGWSCDWNILCGVQDTRLTVWYYPMAVLADQSLVPNTLTSVEVGSRSEVVSFVGRQVVVRRQDGAQTGFSVCPYVSALHQWSERAQWTQALRLCRLVKEQYLWSCLAAMATHAKSLDTAQTAYAAIDAYHKVLYIQHIKGLNKRSLHVAGMYLLGGNTGEAEATLLQEGLVFSAIWSNINTHKWNRALELALRHKTHVETVLLYRKRYLNGFEKSETNEKFIQVQKQYQLNEKDIEERLVSELEDEQVDKN